MFFPELATSRLELRAQVCGQFHQEGCELRVWIHARDALKPGAKGNDFHVLHRAVRANGKADERGIFLPRAPTTERQISKRVGNHASSETLDALHHVRPMSEDRRRARHGKCVRERALLRRRGEPSFHAPVQRNQHRSRAPGTGDFFDEGSGVLGFLSGPDFRRDQRDADAMDVERSRLRFPRAAHSGTLERGSCVRAAFRSRVEGVVVREGQEVQGPVKLLGPEGVRGETNLFLVERCPLRIEARFGGTKCQRSFEIHEAHVPLKQQPERSRQPGWAVGPELQISPGAHSKDALFDRAQPPTARRDEARQDAGYEEEARATPLR